MKNQTTKTKKQTTNSGFTLIETLVAVLILTISLSALLTLITSSIFYARYAKNETIAMYLTQEAIDHIRNDRDTIAFQGGGASWSGFLDAYGKNGSALSKCFLLDGCYFDAAEWTINANLPQACSSGAGCPSFYYEASAKNGTYYNYSTKNNAVQTHFKRTVKMSMPNGFDEVVVEVKVEWMNGSTLRSQILTTSLLRWQ